MQLTVNSTPSSSPPKKARHDDNKLRAGDRPGHDWYRFVLSFPPHLVREYINRFGVRQGQIVLDPFCGTGTTLVECKKLGIESIGVEANPMACFASQVKVDWSVDPAGLLNHARSVAKKTLARLQAEGVEDEPEPPLFRKPRRQLPALLSLPEKASELLLSQSISALPLHKTLALLSTLDERNDRRFARHERLALATALRSGMRSMEFAH
ncbi:MAG: TRM11 family SAM-dependent methyltransferase [Terriglobia bacterium]